MHIMVESNDAPKPYTIHFESRGDILVACVQGEKDSVEISLRYFQDVVDKCKTEKFKKVLIIEQLKSNLSLTDTYTVASQLSEMGRGLIGAFVDTEGSHQTMNEFGHLVASNRGLRGRMFTTVAEAEEWLKTL